MRMQAFGLVAIMAVGVSACDGSHQTTGAVTGAAVGAVAGSMIGTGSTRIAGAAIGALLGAAIGSEIGRRLDERDRMMYAEAAAAAAMQPVGTTSTWQNPQSGNRGTVTPTSAVYKVGDGRDCRNFNETITLSDGKSETIKGRRCKNADGSWEFVG